MIFDNRNKKKNTKTKIINVGQNIRGKNCKN